MTIRLLGLICVVVPTCFAAITNAEDKALRHDLDPQGVLVREGDTPVLYFQRTDRSLGGRFRRSNYVHPLYGLDGEILTEDFPEDHLHHRGIFWAWHQFRINGQPIGDGWLTKAFRWDVHQLDANRLDDGSIRLNTKVRWFSPDWKDGTQPIALEEATVRISPRDGSRRDIDFDIGIRATQADTVIGGSDDIKGYGGFSLRLRMPKDIAFASPQGQTKPTTTATPPLQWMSIGGSLGNRPESLPASTRSGVTVLTHPDSADFVPTWILRSKRSMQNAVWPGRDAVPLPTDHPIRLRYRVVVHRPQASIEEINAWQASYAKEANPAGSTIP